jgi:two-component system NtrC family sensor kinase
MKKIISILCISFLCSNLFAQKVNIDSLTQIVLSRNENTKISAKPNRDSLLKLIPLTKSAPARIRLIYDIIERNGGLNPTEVFYNHNKILAITRQNHDQVGEAVILAELGFTVSVNGDNPEGLALIYKALAIAEKTGNPNAIGIVYDNLGVCTPNNDLKKTYFQNALKFSQAGGNDEFVCFELANLSGIFSNKNMPDSAHYYFAKSYELAVQKDLQINLPNLLLSLASLDSNRQNKLKYLRAALQMPFAKVDPQTKTKILLSMANFYSEHNISDSALWYAKAAYETSLNGAFTERIYPSLLLSRLYEIQNNDSALKYSLIYYTTKDSVQNNDKIVRAQAMAFSQEQKTQEAEAQKNAYQRRLLYYLFAAIIIFLLLLSFIFWRNNRLKLKANTVLKKTLNDLKSTQSQLIQSEKMASLGELTAGIAHEIQNPLNFVNNFSEVSKELLDEMKTELNKGNTEDAKVIADDVIQNLEKINHHGKRAEAIVKGMLQHSQSSTGKKELTDINALADEYLRLSYHGLRAKDKIFNSTLNTDFDISFEKINIIPQDIGRVLLNLYNNAFYAVAEKTKEGGNNYEPTVSVKTLLLSSPLGVRGISISVSDNGNGIPQKVLDKIFQPFFTTKPTGQGPGLGLSLSYDIVKAHGGEIKVETRESESTIFTIELPA